MLGAGLVSVQEFLFDIGDSNGRYNGRHHILQREDAVQHLSWLDFSRPAHQERSPEAAFPSEPLLATERCRATIGPAELFGTVIGGKYDNRVVGDTELVELGKQFADYPIREPSETMKMSGWCLNVARSLGTRASLIVDSDEKLADRPA